MGRVFHLAGLPHFWTGKRGDFDLINGRGTEAVLEAAAAKRIGRVVHCSTESILLPKEHGPSAVIDEDVLPPMSDMPGPYTRSKHRAEEAALAAARDGLDVVIASPTVPLGAGDRNMTPPAAMVSMFLAGRTPFFLDCVLNLADVRDIAEGLVLAAERGRSGERYILGGENIALRDFLRRLEGASGRRMPTRSLPASVALAFAAMSEWIADRVTGRAPPATLEGVRLALRSAPFDSRKARVELGYAPRPIDDALAETVRWLSAMSPPPRGRGKRSSRGDVATSVKRAGDGGPGGRP